MTAKSIQLSTRLTDEDAAFLARLQIEGAQTPSDKIRALLGDARRRQSGSRDYRTALRQIGELLEPVRQEVRDAEHSVRKHSELVRLIDDWLHETMAFLVSETPEGLSRRVDAEKLLMRAEGGLADRAFTLIESVLRLGVTESSPCYDKHAVSERLGPSLDLLEVIRAARERLPSAKPPPAKPGRGT